MMSDTDMLNLNDFPSQDVPYVNADTVTVGSKLYIQCGTIFRGFCVKSIDNGKIFVEFNHMTFELIQVCQLENANYSKTVLFKLNFLKQYDMHIVFYKI